MRTTTLPGTGLRTTRLGFGSAALMGRLGRRESVRLLELAYDSGIRHFDTARAYGYGEAESAVGEFLSSRGDDVTVTTKAGMDPPRRSPGADMAKRVARIAVSRLPGLRRRLRARAQGMVQSGRFAPVEVRSSVETSLSELGLDAVDILLLHECRPEDARTEGLAETLDALVAEGKVRHHGLGTDSSSTRAILAEQPRLGEVVQLRHNPLEPALGDLGGRAVITHTAMRELMARLMEALADPAACREWSSAVGADCASRDVLGGLVVAHALQANAGGVVLFSSTDEGRIRSNAELTDAPRHTPEQLQAFAALCRDTLGAGTPRGA